MVDSANRDRADADGIKVGGHQASSASMVGILTALWFGHLNAQDQVAVKPHASPAFHAIQYLLGNLDRSYLTRLREFGGLQAYPSRSKDPDRVDFSTGSVGLGAAAPLFAGVVRRYVDEHFGTRSHSRFISILGDAELDEGNVWEAIADPATAGLGNVMWVVDFNRQSLDRIVPGVRIQQWKSQFEAAGWHVLEVKYGSRIMNDLPEADGVLLRTLIDEMPNEHYQSLFALRGPALRERLLENASPVLRDRIADLNDDYLHLLLTDLGGHDISALLEAFEECDAVKDRPSVVFAYTVKGWGLPTAGHPRNHSTLLSVEQISKLRTEVGLEELTEWDRFDPSTPEGVLAAERREYLSRDVEVPRGSIQIPAATMRKPPARPVSTQEAFGRVLVELSRIDTVAPYLVTTAPDVATSTNLAGFINRMGVFSPELQRTWSTDDALQWKEGPSGHHIPLGISEMNLFLLLGQLGLSWDLSSQPLLSIGTVYDPFVLRGLDAFLYATYSGSRFIIAGTPSGITLAPEGGAHQSTITPSVGLELPGVTFIEPAYAQGLDWLLCDALASIGDASPQAAGQDAQHGAFYFRLTTRPLDQAPFEMARQRLGDAILRRQVIAGAYRLVDAFDQPKGKAMGETPPLVHIAASGATLPEAIEAAEELGSEGIAAHVVDVTSSDRLFKSWQRTTRQAVRTATTPSIPGAIRAAFPERAPIVTVQDASSHHLAWLGSALGVPAVSLGVDSFGQSGTRSDLYAAHDLTSGSVVNAALAALSMI
ncbi:MAG: pyruvate dehydrogenase [Actinobacteria bacterium]|nr:pyruvate dehydrogenase [Actinomycetota bacterium]MSY98043.1 pyruvate dehydrogenase [Actinomycetota bacterium]